MTQRIIILGAGEVGGNLAQNLTHEAGDITVVDTNSDRLRELQDRFDIPQRILFLEILLFLQS